MIETAQIYLDLLFQITFAVVILSTVIVRLTPGKKDDEKVGKITAKIKSFLSYFPTVGKNPHTKALEEALQKINDEKKD